jgi:hypothetical protein
VLSLIVMLVGLVSYLRLSVREYPNIDEPVVTVAHHYRGASAEIIESQVTKVLEDSLAGIEGSRSSPRHLARRAQPDHRALQARARCPTPPPPTSATAFRRVRGAAARRGR